MQKHRAQVDHAVMVAVAQQGDAVGAGHAGTGAGHDLAGNPAFKAKTAVSGRRIAFRHQHIAIGQHIQPARMVEVFGKGADLGAGRGRGFAARRPAHGRGDVHRRQQPRIGRRQLRVGPAALRHAEGGLLGTGATGHGQQGERQQMNGFHGQFPQQYSRERRRHAAARLSSNCNNRVIEYSYGLPILAPDLTLSCSE